MPLWASTVRERWNEEMSSKQSITSVSETGASEISSPEVNPLTMNYMGLKRWLSNQSEVDHAKLQECTARHELEQYYQTFIHDHPAASPQVPDQPRKGKGGKKGVPPVCKMPMVPEAVLRMQMQETKKCMPDLQAGLELLSKERSQTATNARRQTAGTAKKKDKKKEVQQCAPSEAFHPSQRCTFDTTPRLIHICPNHCISSVGSVVLPLVSHRLPHCTHSTPTH